jgi:hypothetical protein
MRQVERAMGGPPPAASAEDRYGVAIVTSPSPVRTPDWLS